MAHLHGLHGLDEKGMPSVLDYKAWLHIVETIRSKTDMVIQFGITLMPDDQREAVLGADCGAPEMMSLTLNDNHTFRYGREFHARHTLDEDIHLVRQLLAYGVIPEFEVFHPGSVWLLNHLKEIGVVPADLPLWFNLPFGMPGGIHSAGNWQSLAYRVSLLPAGSQWQATCFVQPKGTATPAEQRRFHLSALAMGGNLRIGAEDGPYRVDGTPAASNAELIAEMVWNAGRLGRKVARPDDVRRYLKWGGAQ
jgi:3-keto-5-aminohexanoate cleavage enzyme